MVEFTIKGAYTLREINGTWYVYSREEQTIKEEAGKTFTKAKEYLNKNYKKGATQ